MSEVNPIQTAEPQSPVTAPTSSKEAGPGYSSETKVSSLEQLKEVAPKVYNNMMEGLATTIINEMKAGQKRLKELNDQARRDAEGK
jgi:hypothetical protein